MRMIGSLIVMLTMGNGGLLDAADATAILFERDVRPILKAHCWQCHGDEEKL